MKFLSLLNYAKCVFPNYTWGRMHYLLEKHLLLVSARRCKRLMIFTPPQHFKSTIVSQLFSSYTLITNPTEKLILLSYEHSLAEQHSEQARNFAMEYGPQLTGVQVRSDSKARARWLTNRGGYLIASGIQGAVTGRAATGIIIDDPVKGDEDSNSPVQRDKLFRAFNAVAETRLSPDGFIIVIQTRWHPSDLSGQILEAEANKWTVVRLPALCDDAESDPLHRQVGEALLPERYPLEWYQNRKADFEQRGMSYMWDSLYQADPHGDSSSREWPHEYFKNIWVGPDQIPSNIRFNILSWDPSKGRHDQPSDYSAFTHCLVDTDGHYYVRSWLQRLAAPQLIDVAVRLLEEIQPQAFVYEDIMLQVLFGVEILKNSKLKNIHCPLYGYHSMEKKEVRIKMALGPLLAQRKLHLVTDSPHNRIMLQQMIEIPTGAHDDGPDALTMAVEMVNQLAFGRRNNVRPTILAV